MSLEAWRRTLSTCGCDDESIARLALSTHRQLGRETYRLFDDVVELVDAAKRSGVPLALITNGASDTQREKLRDLGIEQWFGAVVISGEVGNAKPDALVFARALNELAIDGANVWHVGDNLLALLAE